MTLVDASSWIEFLRHRTSDASARVKLLVARGEAGWCELTLVELWNGAQGADEKRALEDLEQEVPIYPIAEPVWARARRLAQRCRQKGVTAPTVDIVIAACAVHHRVELE